MKHQRKFRWQSLFRDLFLGAIALTVLYDQVFIAAQAQPLLIFLVLFLFASIPALRGDSKGDQYGPFARFVMMVLGIPSFPRSENNDGTASSSDTPTSSESPSSVRRSGRSRKSSRLSIRKGRNA